MNEVNQTTDATNRIPEQISQIVEKIFAAAQPGAVYSAPVVSGDYTVITASEVTAGGGFGFASGFSQQKSEQAQGDAQAAASPGGSGGGGGGGGGSSGRPVAVVVIGPDGVRVKPVLDATKLALAGITAWGAMWMMFRDMRKMRKH
jgi:uncharacterized spore protein YtfJ